MKLENIFQNYLYRAIGLGLLALLGVLLLTWVNYGFASKNSGGDEFFVQWMGTRLFLVDGVDPYTQEAAIQIRSAAQNERYKFTAVVDETALRYVSPLFTMILFLPYWIISDFTLARAIWMAILEIFMAWQALLALRLTDWKPGRATIFFWVAFALAWYPASRAIFDGDLVIVIGLAVTGALLSMRNGNDEFAGVLFACTLIKPHLAWLVVLFALYWAANQRRWRVVGWFFSSALLLGFGIALLLPEWLMQNLRSLVAFFYENPVILLKDVLTGEMPGMGPRIGWIISGIVLLLTLIEWRQGKKSSFRGFLWTVCFTMVANQWLTIRMDTANLILLLPVMALLFPLIEDRWERGGKIFTRSVLAVMFIGVWGLDLLRGGKGMAQSSLLIFPIPLFLLIILNWIRWWIFQPTGGWLNPPIIPEETNSGKKP